MSEKEVRVRLTFQSDIGWIMPVTACLKELFGTKKDDAHPEVVTEGRFRIEFPFGGTEGSYIVFIPDMEEAED
jgi:hypothetical protein